MDLNFSKGLFKGLLFDVPDHQAQGLAPITYIRDCINEILKWILDSSN